MSRAMAAHQPMNDGTSADGGMPAVNMAPPRPMAASQPAVSLPHKWRHYSRGRDDIAENTDAEVVQSRGRRCGRRMEQVLDITHRSSKCIGRDVAATHGNGSHSTSGQDRLEFDSTWALDMWAGPPGVAMEE